MSPSTTRMLSRGFTRRCARCGSGHLFRRLVHDGRPLPPLRLSLRSRGRILPRRLLHQLHRHRGLARGGAHRPDRPRGVRRSQIRRRSSPPPSPRRSSCRWCSTPSRRRCGQPSTWPCIATRSSPTIPVRRPASPDPIATNRHPAKPRATVWPDGTGRISQTPGVHSVVLRMRPRRSSRRSASWPPRSRSRPAGSSSRKATTPRRCR